MTLHDVQIPMRPQPAFAPVLRHHGSLITYGELYNYLLRGLRSPPIPGHRLLDALPIASLVLWPVRLRTSHLEELMVVRGGIAPQKRIPPVSSVDDALDLVELAAYGDPADVTVKTYRDQSSRHRDLQVDTLGPTLDAAGNMVFDPSGGEQYLQRGDALELSADPALTIFWSMRATDGGPSLFPTLLSIGTAGAQELIVYFTQGGGVLSDSIIVYPFADTGGVTWTLPAATLSGQHDYLITKPEGSGYSSAWRLSLDGSPPVAPDTVFPTAMTLGSTNLLLGNFVGGGFPFIGSLRGLMVWPTVLDAERRFALDHYRGHR